MEDDFFSSEKKNIWDSESNTLDDSKTIFIFVLWPQGAPLYREWPTNLQFYQALTKIFARSEHIAT